MTNSAESDQTAPQEYVCQLSALPFLMLRFLTVYNILSIMHNILRKKYFDMVSQG